MLRLDSAGGRMGRRAGWASSVSWTALERRPPTRVPILGPENGPKSGGQRVKPDCAPMGRAGMLRPIRHPGHPDKVAPVASVGDRREANEVLQVLADIVKLRAARLGRDLIPLADLLTVAA